MAKSKKFVKYNAWRGIVSERIIYDTDWAKIGITFKTVKFDQSNLFLMDATGWPLPVMEYFNNVDSDFVVLEEDPAAVLEEEPVAEVGEELAPEAAEEAPKKPSVR